MNIKSVAKWAGNLIFGGLILVVLFVLFSPRFLGYQFLTVRSGSMATAIDVGAVIIVQPVKPEAVKVGDVITYRSAEDTKTFVTHRVVDMVDERGVLSFVTRGDANEDPDGTPVSASRLVGQVSLAVPGVGYLTQYIRTPVGLVLFVVVPALMLIAMQLKDVVSAVRALRPKATQ